MANIIFVLLGVLALGVVGGVEHGGDLTALLWLIPIALAMLPCLAAIGRDMEREQKNRNRRGADRRAA